MTRRRGSGTPRPASRSASRSKAMTVRCGAPRSAPTASASSPRLRTRRRGSGTPRPASRSASRSKAMTMRCRSAAFSPDGTRIVTASYDKTARVWDAATGQPIGEPLKGHDGAVSSAALAPTASASSLPPTTRRRASGRSFPIRKHWCRPPRPLSRAASRLPSAKPSICPPTHPHGASKRPSGPLTPPNGSNGSATCKTARTRRCPPRPRGFASLRA